MRQSIYCQDTEQKWNFDVNSAETKCNLPIQYPTTLSPDINIYAKFWENSSKTLQVREWKQSADRLTDVQTDRHMQGKT